MLTNTIETRTRLRPIAGQPVRYGFRIPSVAESFGPDIDSRAVRNSNMLRITVTENASGQRWVLQGRLTESTIDELIANWRANRHCPPLQSCVVDLDEVTSIDKEGEQVILMMIRDGAKFVASGLYTKHLLESLSARTAIRPESP